MKAGKTIVLLYVAFLHLLIAAMLIDADFVYKLERKLGFSPQEITLHYLHMLEHHKKMDSLIPDGATIFIGDSLTQALATSAVSSLSVNYGIGSDTTLGVLKRLPYYKSLNTAKAAVLAIGFNDLIRRENKVILANYVKILNSIPSHTKVIVCAVFPVGDNFSSEHHSNSRISDLNASLEALASEYPNVAFVDAGAFMKNKGGNLKPEFHIGDGVHLSHKGYLVWISILKESLSGA